MGKKGEIKKKSIKEIRENEEGRKGGIKRKLKRKEINRVWKV